RQAPQALVPVQDVALDIRRLVVAPIGAVHDAEAVAPGGPSNGIDVAHGPEDRGVEHEAHELLAGEPPERRSEQEIDRFDHAPAPRERRRRARAMREVIRLAKDRGHLRHVPVFVGGRNEHGDLVEAKRLVGLDQAPDLAGHSLELPPDARVLEDDDTLVALEARIGGRARGRRGYAVKDVALDAMQERATGTTGASSAR